MNISINLYPDDESGSALLEITAPDETGETVTTVAEIKQTSEPDKESRG